MSQVSLLNEVQDVDCSHLTRPSRHGWAFWRDVCVRAPGFPARLVRDLADGHCADAADALDRGRAAVESLWAQARALVQASAQAGATRLGPIAKAIANREMSDELRSHLTPALADALVNEEQRRERLEEEYANRFVDARGRLSQALRRVAGDNAFREAVTWQNQAALRNVLDPLVESEATNAKQRQREDKAASYLQRYCVKNDTIGFFGPVGWARWEQVRAYVVRAAASPRLVVSRHVYFEDWAVQAIADRLAREPELRPWLVPMRKPYLRLSANGLTTASGGVVKLSREEAAVLQVCNGIRTSSEVAAIVSMNPLLDLCDDEQVFGTLEKLVARGWASLGLPVPVGDAKPETRLRSLLLSIGDPQVRQHAVGVVDELDKARELLETAAGNAGAVDRALTRMNELFHCATGEAPTRRGGETYGARTIVYEDCQRGLDLGLGEELLRGIQRPLDLVLASARWYCHHAATAYRHELQQVFQEVGDSRGVEGGAVEFTDFWLRAQGLFFDEQCIPLARVDARLRSTWKTLLGPIDGERRVHMQSDRIERAAIKAFEAPDCGWPSACHHSPDVMLSAADLAALRAGEYSAVLGEIHIGLNTLLTSALFHQHSRPEMLMAAFRRDLPKGRIHPLLSREDSKQPTRTRYVIDAGNDMEVMFSHDACPQDQTRSLAIADLVVERVRDQLVVRTRDGSLRFEVLDVLGQLLAYVVVSRFRLLDYGTHAPRVTIDALVVQRETWTVPCKDLDFAHVTDDAESFLRARRFSRHHALPREVFVKVPWERKPWYLDFASPILVRIFAKQVRNALARGVPPESAIIMTEFLPDHGQLWLEDGHGNRYTSELRMVAVHMADRCAR